MTEDRRRQRAERTRQALIDAALDRFEREGFDATTVNEIVEAAGVSPRTFFHHFKTKEAVLFAGYADRLDEASKLLRDAEPELALWVALEQSSNAVVRAMNEQPQLFLRRGRLYADEPALRATMLLINEEWIDNLRAEIAERMNADPTDLRPRLIATLANGAMRATIDTWIESDGQADLRELFERALQMVRPSIVEIEASWVTETETGVHG